MLEEMTSILTFYGLTTSRCTERFSQTKDTAMNHVQTPHGFEDFIVEKASELIFYFVKET